MKYFHKNKNTYSLLILSTKNEILNFNFYSQFLPCFHEVRGMLTALYLFDYIRLLTENSLT